MPSPIQLESALVQAVENDEPCAPPEDDNLETIWNSTKTPYSDSALEVRQIGSSRLRWQSVRFCLTASVQTTTLQCSLDDFMNKFLSDDAPFPISKYQREHIKDREVSYSPWQELRLDADQPTHPPTFRRDIAFVHPLNNAVGPSEAKTFRQQKYQRFGAHGICVQNTTKIPCAPNR